MQNMSEYAKKYQKQHPNVAVNKITDYSFCVSEVEKNGNTKEIIFYKSYFLTF